MSDLSPNGRVVGRGLNSRGGTAPLRDTFRDTKAVRISLADAAKVHRAADLVRAKAERHHEKHREAKTRKAYTRLLLKSAPTLTLNPPGMVNDPKAALMARASHEVARTHTQRLAHINKARDSLAKTGGLRATRDLQWGDKARASTAHGQKTDSDRSAKRGTTREQQAIDVKVAMARKGARRKAGAYAEKRYGQLGMLFEANAQMSTLGSRRVSDVAGGRAKLSLNEKHEARLQRIDRACENMRASGQVRESRPVSRKVALER